MNGDTMRKIGLVLFAAFLFRSIPTFCQFSKLIDFYPDTSGGDPRGTVLFDGAYLYGMTQYGGVYFDGTIFKIKPDGSGFLKLIDFRSATLGSHPYGSLITDGIFLYGMTNSGGSNNSGTVFKIKPDGTGYVKLLDFTGGGNGGVPSGTLYYDGIFLYGMTEGGGASNDGTVFKIKPDGTAYNKLLDFNGSNGKYPHGSLILIGQYLFGMTRQGGINDDGIIFKIKIDGTGYMKLMDFNYNTSGSGAEGDLISDGTFLYGMAFGGGVNSDGTIFKIMTDGTGFLKLFDFDGATSGSYPLGSLIYDGVFLYGMTEKGGTGTCSNGCGTIFKVKPDGTGYVRMFDFGNLTNGNAPAGSLIISNSFLYGLSASGGLNDAGVLFKYGLAIGIDELSLNSQYSISPNPFATHLTLHSITSTQSSITLYDYTGKEILRTKSNTEETVLNTEGIAAGFYLLRVESGEGVKSYKVIKQ
jgi:uncharacterized repeat protein (TIGR03803 family)